jgi:MFS family permease
LAIILSTLRRPVIEAELRFSTAPIITCGFPRCRKFKQPRVFLVGPSFILLGRVLLFRIPGQPYGTLFDTVGRKAMIAGTVAISGLLLLLTAYLFAAGYLTPVTQTIAWFSIFFFASAAASSAYLTASEIFPLETRALAIACFYALGTAIGGSTSPLLFGWLIESGSAWRVSAGYALAAALLLIAAGTELVLGIDAEGKSLESIADPLSS